MKFDFDTVVDRRNTNSLKYDCAAARGKAEDLLPLWVADMDFRAPEEVIAALKERAEHGIFGYSEPDESYFRTVCGWFEARHGWNPRPDRFALSCGVVSAICTLLRVLTKAGESVLICQPVYYPFGESILENGRKLVVSELVNHDGFYTVDYEDLERKIVENEVKVFLLCNPHNPVGRVWTKEELLRLGEICLRHNVFVVSDEIHADFTYAGNRHTVFASLSRELEQNCAVCTSPSKTFNLAGLHIANTYIADEKILQAFRAEQNRFGYSQSNLMGIVGCQAAYRCGAEWLDALKDYLAGNLALVRETLQGTKCKLVEPQGTYLVWIDCRALGLSDGELHDLFERKAKLWLDDGVVFGKGGSGFERINIACPRSVLKIALTRFREAAGSIA